MVLCMVLQRNTELTTNIVIRCRWAHHPTRSGGSDNILGEPIRHGIQADEGIRLNPSRPPWQGHCRWREPIAERRCIYDPFRYP